MSTHRVGEEPAEHLAIALQVYPGRQHVDGVEVTRTGQRARWTDTGVLAVSTAAGWAHYEPGERFTLTRHHEEGQDDD